MNFWQRRTYAERKFRTNVVHYRGVAQLVACLVRDQEAGRSSRLTPTIKKRVDLFLLSFLLSSKDVGRLERLSSASQPSCKATWLGLRLRPLPVADEGSRSAAAATREIPSASLRDGFIDVAKGQLIKILKQHKHQRQADSSEVASLRPLKKRVDLFLK